MNRTKNIFIISIRNACFALLFVMQCVSCSKTPDTPSVPVIVTPPSHTPTGDIQTFSLQDTLVPYNSGTYIKWLVNNTNDYTIVTIDGTKVALYGDIATGAKKVNTLFTLAVNNNTSATVTLKVADSITTALWNKGKRVKQTKLEYFYQAAGDSIQRWVDTTSIVAAQIIDQRTYFTLDHKSTTIQSTAFMYVAPPDTVYILNPSMLTLLLRGTLYTITTLANDDLVLTYNVTLSSGMVILARNTYRYE